VKIFFVNPPFKAEHGRFSRESRSPSIGRSGVLYYPLWLIYAAAVAEKAGFAIEFLDAPAKLFDESLSLEYIDARMPEVKLFVIDTSTPSIYSDVDFAAKLKAKYPGCFVLLVGTHPSALPAETLEINEKIDAVARREYDYTVRNLAYALEKGADISDVKGITYRRDGIIKYNPDECFIRELDDIPFASEFIKKHLSHTDYFFPASSYPEIQIFTGRGCPARCNYCVYPETMHGHEYRLRSAGNVVAEFSYIALHFPDIKEIVIEDDTFTASKERVREICLMLIEKKLNKRLRWLCNARVNLDPETMKLMKKAGCRLIIPGIESTNQQILNNIRKGTTVSQIKDYILNANKSGLLVHACYMFGNKGETKETMMSTLTDALAFKTDTAQFFPLVPYPGTEAYEWAKSNGYLAADFDDYCKEDGTINCVLNLPGISSVDLVEFCNYARRKYYLRPWYFMHRLWIGLHDIQDLKRSLKAFMRFRKYLFNAKKDKENAG